MENTPLELYETAYKLHYIENRISEAVKYYEALIREFPDSNECGYAAIQVQKIKAGDLAKELIKTPKTGSPLAVVAFIICLFTLTCAGSAGYYFFNRLKNGELRLKLTTSALGKMYRGEDDEALKALTELKILAKGDITPFELSADIYRKQFQFEQARSEYELFFKLNPGRQPTKGELVSMKRIEKEWDRIIPAPVEQDTEIQQPEPVQPKPAPVPRAPIKRVKREKKQQQSTQSQKKIKGLYLVDPDSISYF